MTMMTALAVTDDVVLPVSSVLTIMKELGKEVTEPCDPLIITQASTISESLDDPYKFRVTNLAQLSL